MHAVTIMASCMCGIVCTWAQCIYHTLYARFICSCWCVIQHISLSCHNRLWNIVRPQSMCHTMIPLSSVWYWIQCFVLSAQSILKHVSSTVRTYNMTPHTSYIVNISEHSNIIQYILTYDKTDRLLCDEYCYAYHPTRQWLIYHESFCSRVYNQLSLTSVNQSAIIRIHIFKLLGDKMSRLNLLQNVRCASSAPSYYLNHCWLVVHWAFMNKFQVNQVTKVFSHENAFGNIVCKMPYFFFSGSIC